MALKVNVGNEKVEIPPSFIDPIIIDVKEPRKVFLTTDDNGNVTSYIIEESIAKAELKNQLDESVTTKITPRVLDRLLELFYGDTMVQRRE